MSMPWSPWWPGTRAARQCRWSQPSFSEILGLWAPFPEGKAGFCTGIPSMLLTRKLRKHLLAGLDILKMILSLFYISCKNLNLPPSPCAESIGVYLPGHSEVLGGEGQQVLTAVSPPAFSSLFTFHEYSESLARLEINNCAQ